MEISLIAENTGTVTIERLGDAMAITLVDDDMNVGTVTITRQ